MTFLRRTTALLLIFVVALGTLSGATSALAAVATQPDVTVLENDFIKVTVDNATGRFGIRTVEGQPIRKKDDNVNMLFRGDDPETSFTTFRIDGTDYIFGNPYKFAADFFSEITPPVVVNNPNGTKQIETVWKIKGVAIKQILMMYSDPNDLQNAGNVNIRYEVVNRSGADVQIGSRILLDTMVAGNDGPQFQIGTAYKSPLQVERKLVHDPENLGVPVEDRAFYKLPPYWVMRDTHDLTNPLATNVVAYGFNNFAERNINIVDEMIVGHWNGLANTKWDYTPNGNLDFTRDTNDYGSADSAVAFYWNPAAVANNTVQSFETVYGLGEIIEPDKVFSIRYLDTPQQLAVLDDNSAYTNDGVFDIIAEVENLAMYGMEHSRIDVDLTLESGLDFVKLDAQGNIMRDANGKPLTESFRTMSRTYRKGATPEEAAQGIVPKYKPGDTITASFKVVAKGKPWPTTQEYLISARSPETQREIEGLEDEGIKAQYESNKSNFILLPAVGEAAATYVYGLAPNELFQSDVKYITANLTNIGAYNTGNETSDPNFDLYFREIITGKRYRVPVKESVTLLPTDDGFSGDMRITYEGGDLVDEAGDVIEADLGPELPLGEYQLEIDYKGDAGGDEELAALFDLTTEQTFLVTDNEESRIREAGILAVYKQAVDISHVTPSLDGDLLEELNELFPDEPFEGGEDLYSAVMAYKQARTFVAMASKAVDPEFETAEFLDDSALEETPTYHYRMFESEEDLEEFFGDEEIERESLVVVRGMIREVGEGDEAQVIVDTKTEPAIINEAVAYEGKDMVFARGKLDVFGVDDSVDGYDDMPFFDTLFVKGEGTLSVVSSGFVFHEGEWTLDFYNGFEKTLGDGYLIEDESFPESEGNEEDNSLNGTLSWAVGALGDRLNPMRQLMIEQVYFNKQSLFSPSLFTFDGFGFTFNDFVLTQGGISFGGSLSLKVINAEIRNVVFNDKGFVGVDAHLKFDLNESLGLISPDDSGKADSGGDTGGTGGDTGGTGGGTGGAGGGGTGGGAEPEEPSKPRGSIDVVHFVQEVDDVSNQYGVSFAAQLKSMVEIEAELAFKRVADGRILPDVVAFGTTLPKPGVLITGATYLTAVRGAVRELADTIAGGTKDDPFPLVIEAGVSLKFGVSPAYHFGDIDLTLKRTGIKIEGKMDFSAVPEPEDEDLLPMLTYALLEAQWVKPWFVRLEAEVDIGGWDLIVGQAGIFVGQNLEKNRIDFEGYIGAKVQIPSDVPVVGGIPLASVFFGVNNDKIWGSVGVLFVTLGVTYYWGGGVEFGTNGEQLPEGLVHLVVDNPERGPQLLVIGQGLSTVATSWLDTEQETQEIVYREVADGVSVLDTGAMNVGIGGITVKNGGRVHEIPMAGVSGNAIIEMEYVEQEMPSLTLKDASGKTYPIVFDNTNTNPKANAFTQFIPAASSSEGVDVRKAYILIPSEKTQQGGVWTLTAVDPVETRLLNAPNTPTLKNVTLAKNQDNANLFTASWAVDHAKAGDTINLYLAKDAVTAETTTLDGGAEVLEPGDPGLLIAKDIPVDHQGGVSGNTTSGSLAIDVTQVSMLGDVEDIRGLLQQGEYYLRAELRSETAFGTKTSADRFEIIDPLAPKEVEAVTIEPGGNGYFELSFKPSPKKAGHEPFEHSYRIEAFRQNGGQLEPYSNFGELLFTEEELAPYWNSQTGRYEGIRVGGWAATTTDDAVDVASLEGTVMSLQEEVKYTGLEVGHTYAIGVSAVTKPTKEADKNENFHFASTVKSASKLLPVPAKPKLSAASALMAANNAPAIHMLTKETEQSIALTSNQKDIVVEAFYGEESLGTFPFANEAAGSRGTLQFDRFKTDGPYAIELVAQNTKTKDVSTTMLYMTVDTEAPVLYIDKPATGERASEGMIEVAGQTSNDATLLVNGTAVTVEEDGRFHGTVPIDSAEPNVALRFVATDGAGNENAAVVDITNDIAVPVAVVLEQIPALRPGTERTVQASLRVPDGKDAQGKPKFKLIPVPADRLTFEVQGDAVSIEDGKVKGDEIGASLIQATYRVSDRVTIEGMAVASVQHPEPMAMKSIALSTSAITGTSGKTKLSWTLPADVDLGGKQLVYRRFGADSAVVPGFREPIADWAFVPQNGIVDAQKGESIVVALRTSSAKEAVAVSAATSAEVWQQSGGFAGGFGGGGSSDVKINGKQVSMSSNSEAVEVSVAGKDLEGIDGDIVIASEELAVPTVTIQFRADAVKKVIQDKKTIRIELPKATLELPPEKLSAAANGFEVTLTNNGEAAASETGSLLSKVQASLLGAGDGVTIESNLPSSAWDRYVDMKLPLPATVAAKDLTAVVLKSEDGRWTPLPWSMDDSEGAPKVDVRLTGEGSIVFVGKQQTFVDVPYEFWGRQSIEFAAEKLLVMGKGENLYDPEASITRAEYPTLLLRVAGLMNKTGSRSFADVKTSDWYSESVSAAAELGLVNGNENGEFAPNETLTRVEAMAMVGRLVAALGVAEPLDEQETAAILAKFEDAASIPEWARNEVAAAIQLGIIEGSNGSIAPNGVLTRAQAAAIAVRIDQLITKK